MIGFLIALLSGALMSIQGVFNTQVTKTTGMWVGNGWVQFTAFAVCLAMWFIKSIEALGPARSALLIVIAQLTVAYLIQLFGLFGMDREPFSWRKAGGLLLAVVGIAVFQWK